ncbi:prephenate dehydrogenase/arogenate dehydrogenase family protein [uncultured Selenomonas sp.]|uniref:prephenate dehydrogenase n=1 Tax=uncultured Selenomonas sp. TaxID=159275 RepID=UPI0028D54E8F|nr:prephenate dehydrogenase/arogenate dehydrogenase family protein [uncultured Selenomonas sp.]
MSCTKVAVIGVGLIGGSFGLCLKDALGDAVYITGLCRTEASMRQAVALGAVDEASTDLAAVVGGADIIYLSPPVLQIVPMVRRILPYLKQGAILTDAGSTKGYLYKAMQEILPPYVHYIPGHPMTGREKSGVSAATKDLFAGKAYVIIDTPDVPPETKDRLMDVLRYTRANFTTLDLAQHDRCAAVISHVPHLAAAGLVTLLNRSGDDLTSCLKLIGGGFKDTTRIASSNADMWADICMTNAKPIADALRTLQDILDNVISAVETGDRQAIHAYFTASKERRDSILLDAAQKFDTN